jgi:hypothetical protein
MLSCPKPLDFIKLQETQHYCLDLGLGLCRKERKVLEVKEVKYLLPIARFWRWDHISNETVGSWLWEPALWKILEDINYKGEIACWEWITAVTKIAYFCTTKARWNVGRREQRRSSALCLGAYRKGPAVVGVEDAWVSSLFFFAAGVYCKTSAFRGGAASKCLMLSNVSAKTAFTTFRANMLLSETLGNFQHVVRLRPKSRGFTSVNLSGVW